MVNLLFDFVLNKLTWAHSRCQKLCDSCPPYFFLNFWKIFLLDEVIERDKTLFLLTSQNLLQWRSSQISEIEFVLFVFDRKGREGEVGKGNQQFGTFVWGWLLDTNTQIIFLLLWHFVSFLKNNHDLKANDMPLSKNYMCGLILIFLWIIISYLLTHSLSLSIYLSLSPSIYLWPPLSRFEVVFYCYDTRHSISSCRLSIFLSQQKHCPKRYWYHFNVLMLLLGK